ncbi:hypothetical protein DYB30_006661 [Aphanomyces astaci]|uniref:chitin synthase n=1 Tax=Aphanomyces astaci TaxID=112090 RepID=A0A397C5D2_APHAT|nr:hypothetical protein DYB30_006661 [Aphanomyces astaci]
MYFYKYFTFSTKAPSCAAFVSSSLTSSIRRRFLQLKASAVTIQSVVRMRLHRARFVQRMADVKSQQSMHQQLRTLQERLQVEQNKKQHHHRHRRHDPSSADQLDEHDDGQQRRKSSAQLVMADAGGMIDRIEKENMRLRREVEELKAALATWKDDADKLKQDKEIATAAHHVKLRQAEELARDKDKTIAQLHKELDRVRGPPHGGGTPPSLLQYSSSRSRRTVMGSRRERRGLERSEDSPEEVAAIHNGAVDVAAAVQKAIETNAFLIMSAQQLGASLDVDATATRMALSNGLVTANSLRASPSVSSLKDRVAQMKNKYAQRQSEQVHRASEDSLRQSVSDSLYRGSMAVPPMPPGWEMRMSRSKGRPYFCHEGQRLTLWDPPTDENIEKAIAKRDRYGVHRHPRDSNVCRYSSVRKSVLHTPRQLAPMESFEFGGAYVDGSPIGSDIDASFNQVPLWRDTKDSANSYLSDEPAVPPPAALLNMAKNVQERQQSFRQASLLRMGSTAIPHLPNTVEEFLDGGVSYEGAFRLVQLAVQMEADGNPAAAIQLYVDAGRMLVEVGKREVDPLLQKGIRQKSHEMLQRAEELDKWMNDVAEEARRAALPPALKIARTNVPLVEQSWKGRLPPHHDADEFKSMRYTAVATKDPIQFSNDKYILRVHQLQRQIKVFITVTMYNEEGSELKATLTGLAQGIRYMCKEYGADYWQHVAIAVVSDGRTKASPTCLEFLTQLGSFDEEIMTVTSLGVDTQMHLFESTVQLVENHNFENFSPPMQLLYALKEHNGGKLNSHLWFFNAFAEQLNPTYTVLVDVGTIPAESSVFRLIRSMERNYQIGGVAGEIAVDKPNYFNPVVAAQHFEYKISNIMDKSLESVFGFISVLPGAFSAYRFEAIRAIKGVGPLPEYFKSLTSTTKELGPFQGNMYLAEDRILCFELLAREGRQWTMHYVKDAIARTDVPETLVDLIKQRRRWLNGSFFAGLFAIGHFGRVWRLSAHSPSRKLVFTLQFLYLAVQNFLSWFLLSNLYLTFYFVLTLALHSPTNATPNAILEVILTVYLAIVGGLLVFALGNKPEPKTASFYLFSCLYLGIVMMVVTGLSFYGLVAKGVTAVDPRQNLTDCPVSKLELTGGVVSSLGLVFMSAFLHGEFSILLSFVQYFFMLPTFVNILGIYAYSNLHDLSWGTKGLESGGGHGPAKQAGGNVKDVVAQQKKLEAARQVAAKEKEDVDNSFRAFRSTLLLSWLTTNALWMYIIMTCVATSCYLKYLSYIVACFNIIRFVGATTFLALRICRRFGIGGCVKGVSKDTYDRQLPPEWQAHRTGQAARFRPQETLQPSPRGPYNAV